MEVKVKVEGAEKLAKELKLLPLKVRKKAAQAMKEVLTGAVGYVIKKHLTGGTTKTRLGVRTGNLRRSIRWKVNESRLEGEFGSYDTSYAAIHEFGGTIRPKRGRYLAIPFRSGKTPAGVWKSPRLFENTFVRKNIIFQKRGKDKIVPLFVLKKSVKIPARPFINPTAEKYIIPKYLQKLEEMKVS